MSLVGLPLILLTGFLGIVAVAATLRGWRLAGRARMPVRIAGLVVIEVLLVVGVGLVANRHESFYPSWQALAGTDNVTTVAPAATGRLDGTLDAGGTVTWSPPEATQWRLAAPPQLVVPPDYGKHADRTFPIVVALTTPADAPEVRRVAASATGVLTVVLEPTAGTTATALSGLLSRLGQDARVTDSLAILADGPFTALAASWPGRPPVVAGHSAAALDQATGDLPAPLAPPLRLPS